MARKAPGVLWRASGAIVQERLMMGLRFNKCAQALRFSGLTRVPVPPKVTSSKKAA